MLLNDLRANLPKAEPAAGRVPIVLGPPDEEAPQDISPIVAADAEESDDDLDYTFDLDRADLDNLKEIYEWFDKVLNSLLRAETTMPIELVKGFETAMGNLHSLINECEPYKPEEAGIPCIAVTLEDEYRQGGAC